MAAHAVWVNEADLAILKARGVGVAHCPSSNMKLASGVAPVTRMLALDLAVGLGPDGPAGSNNDFNLFEEMDLAAKLQKVTTMNPQALPAGQALEMATIRGARALGMEKEIGSLEAGKRADLITVRIDRPHAAAALRCRLADGVRAQGVGRARRDGERQAGGARCEDPDAGREGDSRQGGGVSREGQRIAEIAARCLFDQERPRSRQVESVAGQQQDRDSSGHGRG